MRVMSLWRQKTCTLALFTVVQILSPLVSTMSLASTNKSKTQVEGFSPETTNLAVPKSIRQECLASPPNQTTFTQSAVSATAAYVIYKDCAILTIRAENRTDGTQAMDASSQKIEIIRSFPQVDYLDLSGNNIVGIARTEGTVISTLDLSDNGIQDLSNLSIPSSVTTLNLDNNKISTISTGAFAASVTSLSIRNNSLTLLENVLVGNTTTYIDLSDNLIPKFTNWQLPHSLKIFTCHDCEIESIAGVLFPAQMRLSKFDLSGSNVQVFEVANSSVKVLESVENLVVTTVSSICTDSHAVAHVTHSMTLCVLPDAYFDEKYRVDSELANAQDRALPGVANEGHDSGNLTNWMVLAMICLGAMFSCVLGGAIFVIFRRRQKIRDEELREAETLAFDPAHSVSSKATKYMPSHLSGMSRTGQTDSVPEGLMSDSTLNFVLNDIRSDDDILQCRLLQEEVVRGKLLAKGGYGAVYMATFQNETVVAKQLLPERARDKRWLSSFMDEIRLCLTLNHPKIVRFIGVTWSTMLDISMVMEYMPRGDLSTMLQMQFERESQDEYARDGYSWFHADGEVKCKSLLALDIAEALVYLHSFESPIIHRDLKPKNVLLSESWEAKLTDFGTSRELDEDQTMTAEIGTISWIAPEVLRGEQYSEKADVYSFGVILTELDTCYRPYSQGIPGESHDKTSNTRIAVLVSAGSLKPQVHSDCPRSVSNLVDKCLAYDPVDRPSALQLHYELRNLELEEDELVASARRLTERRDASFLHQS